jgi:CRISPR-associated protein Cas1
MGSLYIDASIEEIRADGQTLALYQSGGLAGRVPLVPLERVILQGNVKIETRALHRLAEQGVSVHLLSGRQGRWKAALLGPEHKHAALRVAQMRAHLDPQAARRYAERWVAAKLQAQREAVEEWLGWNPPRREAVAAALDALHRAAAQVPGAPVESLRGIEGAAARAYFGALGAVVPPAVAFDGRNRRPPLDPVNALLSLTYTLLYGELGTLVRLAGFDPYVGFFHCVAYGFECLAADLQEPRRPEADRWVVGLFRDAEFRPDDFAHGGERAGCWLREAARRRYYLCYEEWAQPRRPLWRQEVYALAAELTGEPPPQAEPAGAGALGEPARETGA